jgi:hypothetical protein
MADAPDPKQIALEGRAMLRSLREKMDDFEAILDALDPPEPWPKGDGLKGLAGYKGPSNHHGILPHLVGERIIAAFQAKDPREMASGINMYLVLRSGAAFVLGQSPSFWKVDAETVARVVNARKDEIGRYLDELRQMPGVNLP